VPIQPTSLSGTQPLRSSPELRSDRAAVSDGRRTPDAGSPASSALIRSGAVVPNGAVGGASTDAPQGVDPQLWSILTAEERDYFARSRELGPLTYGRQSSASSPTSIRGARFDVRV
jgi:hypothetical protein